MRTENMMERLSKLSKSEGGLNQFIFQQREKRDYQLRLVKDEQDKLEGAIKNINSLKSKMKMNMAQARVIDLSKQKEN